MDLLNVSKTRYTTKAYDPDKKIPQEQFERLLEILRLTPSSINIQPWHFFIADHAAAKERIAKALVGKYAYNAPKVLDSSHTILLCTKADINEQHLETCSSAMKPAAALKMLKPNRARKTAAAAMSIITAMKKATFSAGRKIRPLLRWVKFCWRPALKALTLRRLAALMKALLLKSWA